MKFHENPSSRSRVVPCRRTDRHDEASCKFRNFANAPKKHKETVKKNQDNKKLNVESTPEMAEMTEQG
jgi:hypothetical protein